MVTQVKEWGNSQGIRFSKELLGMIGVHVNDYLDVQVKGDSIVLRKTFTHKTLEERAAMFGKSIGPYEEFSWGEAEGREQW